MNECDVTFEAMGCEVRLIIGAPMPGERPPAAAAERAQSFIDRFDRTLSRFKADSELCALNADPRAAVPASDLLRRAVHAGLWAAEQTDGLVDPTMVREIESVGYACPERASPRQTSPMRSPSHPSGAPPGRIQRLDGARWTSTTNGGLVTRPAGIAFDTGGTGKGLAADMVVAALRGYSRVVVDCGGDVRIGGFAAKALPFEVQIEHPLTGARAHSLRMGSGGIATSGLNVRVWRRDDGTYAHHLLDPATGKPAWTGIVGATALGDTALEAETTSKAALLSGPDGRPPAPGKPGRPDRPRGRRGGGHRTTAGAASVQHHGPRTVAEGSVAA